jgi:hypothetical protein
MPDIYNQLVGFCLLANREIFRYYGSHHSCVFSTGVICELLAHFGIKAEPLRVEAGIFPDDRKLPGCVLGSSGDGTRRPAAKPDHWQGHLVSLVENRYLIDTTLDQADRHLNARPVVIDLTRTTWFKPNLRSGQCTGLLRLWDGVLVRYSPAPRQVGWKHAGDFRPRRRREIAARLIELAEPLFTQKPLLAAC